MFRIWLPALPGAAGIEADGTANTPLPHALATLLKIRTRHGDFADNVSIRTEHLADGPSQEFGDPISNLGPGNEEHPVAVASKQVGFEGEDFGRTEWTCGHASEIRLGMKHSPTPGRCGEIRITASWL